MTTREEAREIAQNFIARVYQSKSGSQLVITDLQGFPNCWVVTYNTREYAETGDLRHSLAGNGPLIINRLTGFVRQGTAARPVDEQLDDE